ncbi:MAG: hypothetical protein HYS25_08695 [Ignavibacteriales bacterium]|nr:hypothetical protein [Ignavibacteriales bacterium]
MSNQFEDSLVKDIYSKNSLNSGNLIKAADAEIKGLCRVTLEEDEHEGVKIYLKKDANDAIKEIKFICSCGQTKSILLDYSE